MFANQHGQLESFNFGDVESFISSDRIKYRAMNVDLEPGNISSSGNTTSYNLSCVIMDLTAKELRKDELDVLSDLSSIAEDVVSMIKNPIYQDDYWSGDDFPVEYMVGAFQDSLVVLKFPIQINVDFKNDNQIIP